MVTVMIERGLLPAKARAAAAGLVNEQAAARAVDLALDPALEPPLQVLRGLLARVAASYGNDQIGTHPERPTGPASGDPRSA